MISCNGNSAFNQHRGGQAEMFSLLVEGAFCQRTPRRVRPFVDRSGSGAHGEIGFDIMPKALAQITPLAALGRKLEGDRGELDLRPDVEFFAALRSKGWARGAPRRVASGKAFWSRARQRTVERPRRPPLSGEMAWLAHQLKKEARPQDSLLSIAMAWTRGAQGRVPPCGTRTTRARSRPQA